MSASTSITRAIHSTATNAVSNSVASIGCFYERLVFFAVDRPRVIVEPTDVELPDFLKGFQPDLIAVGETESVVVEVKAGAQAYEEYRRTVGVDSRA